MSSIYSFSYRELSLSQGSEQPLPRTKGLYSSTLYPGEKFYGPVLMQIRGLVLCKGISHCVKHPFPPQVALDPSFNKRMAQYA